MVKVQVKKLVGYARVSSESQIDNTSISEQVEKIKDYAKLHDLEIAKIFIDEGRSGSQIDSREEYKNMIEYIKENEVNAIVVYKADRIHRKLFNLLGMIDELEKLQVAFISIKENFDTSTAQGILFMQMLGSFSEFERNIINDRTKEGRVSKAKSNKFAGGKVPYGYKLIDSNTLEVESAEAEVVKKIFKLRVEGLSLSKIADKLNKEGITNKQGKQWTKQAIDYILKNETYTGKYRYDGKVENNNIEFKIEKVISKQLYNKANIRG